jgi:TPP-dependent pyruvate/acetoin dehydrogenase alpha subunit
MSLDPQQDWIVPQYRELMVVVHHGYPLEMITATYMGKTTAATRIPDGVNVLPTQVALAAQLPQASRYDESVQAVAMEERTDRMHPRPTIGWTVAR